jgi:hypothetical protein
MSRWQLFRNVHKTVASREAPFGPKQLRPPASVAAAFGREADASGPPSHSSEYLREESGIGIPPSTTRRITISTILQLLL